MSHWKLKTATVFAIVLSALAKVHAHFIRIALLCILGLLGMYLLHQLAQDWNRIRGGGGGGGGSNVRPQRLVSVLGMATRFFRISKRSVDSQVIDTSVDNLSEKFSNIFSSILLLDPIGCARKFLCYSASKPVANLTENESTLLQLFESYENSNGGAFRIFRKAAILGRTTQNVTFCENSYQTCYLTNKQLSMFYNYF